jgi:hypothetical protein
MMPSIDAWAGDSTALAAWRDDTSHAVDFARIINDDTTSITVIRAGSPIAAQTVRIETMRRGETTFDVNGRQHNVDAIVFGYNGHATIADTDLVPLDRFAIGGRRYEIIAVLVDLENVLQAICEAKT